MCIGRTSIVTFVTLSIERARKTLSTAQTVASVWRGSTTTALGAASALDEAT